jgi:hypothetical protein
MEAESSHGMLWYQNEMTDAGMLMPAVSALMLLPSYAYIHVFFNNLCKRLNKINIYSSLYLIT